MSNYKLFWQGMKNPNETFLSINANKLTKEVDAQPITI